MPGPAGCDGGWADNFAWGKLTIGSRQKVYLVDGDAIAGAALYVDELDLVGVGSHLFTGGIRVYYRNGGVAKRFLMGDANLDGKVGLADLLALADNYGDTGCGASVPEPATLAFLALGAVALARRRRR